MKDLKKKKNELPAIFISLVVIITIALSILSTPIQGRADDFGSALKTAILSFPPYPDIAGMGGAWAGVPRLSSDNPASLSIFNEYELKAIFYTNPTQIHFNRGEGVYALSTGILVPLADGCLKVSYNLIDGDKFYDRSISLPGSPVYNLDSKDVKIFYGRKINDNLALGLRFKPWGSSELKLKYSGFLLGQSKERVRFNIMPGILYEPIKDWHLGLTYQYEDDRTKTTMLDPATFMPVKTTEHSYTRIWRIGASWQPKEGTLLALDWQVGEIDGPESGDYDVDMFFFGVEQYLHRNVALRMGSLDGSPTAGLRVSYKKFFLDYSYIKESLKDLEHYVGSSKAHTIAVCLAF